MRKKIVALTGAGISAESGIKTFRDSDGLWEGHDVMSVASYDGWIANPKLVLEFYNARRSQLLSVSPNHAHQLLADLQSKNDICIITQNVDDLHERAGSKNVIHLHGELKKVRSTKNPTLIYNWTKDCNLGDQCELGAQLRPHIVWFQEEVPLLETAAEIIMECEILLIIGTSLQVYPAAGLYRYAPPFAELVYIDRKPNRDGIIARNLNVIADSASTGLQSWINLKQDLL